MNNVNYQIRQGRLEDSKRVWEIRNNFLNRQNSNEQDEIAYQNHEPWFTKKYFSGQDNHLYVIAVDGLVVGYLRFDFEQGSYVASIALEPQYQGRGLGSALLTEGLNQSNLAAPMTAQVKKFNPASFKLFQKCGFKIINEDNDNYFLQYEK